METSYLIIDRKSGVGIKLPAGWPFWKTQHERVSYILEWARKIARQSGDPKLQWITTGQWYEIGLPRFSSIFSVLRDKGYVIQSERIYRNGKSTRGWKSWLIWKPGDPGLMPARQIRLFN